MVKAWLRCDVKIAIVGGSSALAKYLIKSLIEKNEVISLGRKDCDLYCELQDNLDSITLPNNIDTVVHVAAAFNGKTDEEILAVEEINALGTLKACMAARKANVKHFILISSQYTVLSEESLYYSIYSLSKRHSEELAHYYCKMHNLPLTILRPTQIYDAKGAFKKHQPLIYLMADSAETGKDIFIYGRNDASRNYIQVEDLVKIITLVIERKCEGIFSCTNPKNVKLSEIAKSAQLAFNKGGNITFLKEKADIPDNIFDNNIELYKKIGFYPQIDIQAGMNKIAEFRQGGAQ